MPAVALVLGYDRRAGERGRLALGHGDAVRADPTTQDDLAALVPARPSVADLLPGQSADRRRQDQLRLRDLRPGRARSTRSSADRPPDQLPRSRSTSTASRRSSTSSAGSGWTSTGATTRQHRPAPTNYANINLQPGYQLLRAAGARLRPLPAHGRRLPPDRAAAAVRARAEAAVRAQASRLTAAVDRLHDHEATSRSAASSATDRAAQLGALRPRAPGRPFLPGPDPGLDRLSDLTTARRTSRQARDDFTHPDVAVAEGRERRRAREKLKPKVPAPPPRRRGHRPERQRRRGLGGERAVPAGAARLRDGAAAGERDAERADCRTTSTRRSTTTRRQPGAKAAATRSRSSSFRPTSGRCRRTPRLRALEPGRDAHRRRRGDVPQPADAPAPTATAPKHQTPNVRADSSTGAGAARSRYVHRVPFKLQVPTVLERSLLPRHPLRRPASRLYWIDRKRHDKAIRLVFRTGAGEYWGIQETDMGRPPVLADRSFQPRDQGKGRSSSTTPARTCTWWCCGARRELLGREHAARLALERDDARDRERA